MSMKKMMWLDREKQRNNRITEKHQNNRKYKMVFKLPGGAW